MMFLRTILAALLVAGPLTSLASAAQVSLDPASPQMSRPLSAVPVDRAPGWPAGRYFRVEFAGMASDSIIVNGYKADVVMLDNAPQGGPNYAIARLPSDAAVTRGFITFMVTAKTASGYAPAVPLKIVLDQ
jgi:hypothetical protein